MTENKTVDIMLNGRPGRVEAGSTVSDLLSSRQVRPSSVVVEINGRVIARDDWPETVFAPGDSVELVQFMGGG